MTRLEKYEAVNKCETLMELADVIMKISDEYGQIQGRERNFKASTMSDYCLRYRALPENVLTREFGIRQQACYIIRGDE